MGGFEKILIFYHPNANGFQRAYPVDSVHNPRYQFQRDLYIVTAGLVVKGEKLLSYQRPSNNGCDRRFLNRFEIPKRFATEIAD